jgi:hypothetical protein
VFIWFAVGAVVAVALVFDSSAMDFRLVVLGAVLPVVEGAVSGPWLLHTLLASVTLLGGVMLVARGRRLVQRRWLGVPIGLMAHLVLDGTWADTEVFWWPFAGIDALGGSRVPEFGRGVIGLLQEVVGLALGVWAWRRFGLHDPAARRALRTDGRLTALRRA